MYSSTAVVDLDNIHFENPALHRAKETWPRTTKAATLQPSADHQVIRGPLSTGERFVHGGMASPPGLRQASNHEQRKSIEANENGLLDDLGYPVSLFGGFLPAPSGLERLSPFSGDNNRHRYTDAACSESNMGRVESARGELGPPLQSARDNSVRTTVSPGTTYGAGDDEGPSLEPFESEGQDLLAAFLVPLISEDQDRSIGDRGDARGDTEDVSSSSTLETPRSQEYGIDCSRVATEPQPQDAHTAIVELGRPAATITKDTLVQSSPTRVSALHMVGLPGTSGPKRHRLDNEEGIDLGATWKPGNLSPPEPTLPTVPLLALHSPAKRQRTDRAGPPARCHRQRGTVAVIGQDSPALKLSHNEEEAARVHSSKSAVILQPVTSTEAAFLVVVVEHADAVTSLLKSPYAWGLSCEATYAPILNNVKLQQILDIGYWLVTATIPWPCSLPRNAGDSAQRAARPAHSRRRGVSGPNDDTNDDYPVDSTSIWSSDDDQVGAETVRGKWQPEEDENLARWVLEGMPWSQVYERFPARTRNAVSSRWYVVLRPKYATKSRGGQD
ncbi:hypothetical protein H2200_013641 [Cladophialophora chaetospira]|uniref:Myb-like domain-containing protein n=1 Tax=Cladophialophora chaetospira TaxID=386627 RepID=A0AA38U4F0_9EURO|nr:hypothetical protein H2200_013641 [Cladophialophora chaetospira]